ncbi:uncharacterized protein F4812DRAFT_432008 [Daldinia caldariorum]|uniref:uncharacterized protein n=1 Tax=Daldinia caldariorum TaxID=326644 RepID=UPI0020088C52|nr:uncharacterized protein F4812DRAFT_432008 [Daldinia caldariorum]KAI1467282.1 hypothetical protein F4812DRAFT_432008 [Daldinia caldariorum]
MARRSARIASASKRTNASSAPQLGALSEKDEQDERMPTATERTPTSAKPATRRLDTIASSPMHQPATPALATPVKLPMSEMHPSKVHPTTAAPSSGLKLGFVDIDYTKKPNEASGLIQSTPSKTPAPSSDFTFRYARINRNGDEGLTPRAKKMMEGIREEAAKIKVELAAKHEQEKEEEAANEGRKIRQAKGKAGRFSAAHMAEFKKMDSIENHPSAFRAVQGRSTPLKGGLKRSQSKANLDDVDSARSKKSSTRPVPAAPEKEQEQSESPVKRTKQRADDDVSGLRPVSRDGSFLPRPKSSGNDSTRSGIPRSYALANLMTPTKSSLARATSIKAPSVALTKSVSKPDLGTLGRSSSNKGISTLKKSMSNNAIVDNKPTHVQTPGRFDRVKSILKRHVTGTKSKSSIPQLVASPSKTSLPERVDEELPQAPLTTPGRKLERRVNFTPEAKRATTMLLDSPSPVKSSIPRSKALSHLRFGSSTAEKLTSTKVSDGEVTYPDLSAYCRDVDEVAETSAPSQPLQSVPGTFTFRSDHTISFGGVSPQGFGGAAGQASLRHVRNSVLPATRMPGSFPGQTETSPNKENADPAVGSGIPHGMSNKKRHRATWDEEEEEEEGSKRGAKKLRKDAQAPEGYALVAPRLASESPTKKLGGTAYTPSPQKKKKGGLSLSRLNMLARPKVRK